MKKDKLKLTGLTKALLSGYQHLYIPLDDNLSSTDYGGTVFNIAKNLGLKAGLSKKILIDEETNQVSKILVIKVTGKLVSEEELEAQRKANREEQVKEKVKTIKRLLREGYNHNQIAKSMGYKSSVTVFKLLREGSKIDGEKNPEGN